MTIPCSILGFAGGILYFGSLETDATKPIMVSVHYCIPFIHHLTLFRVLTRYSSTAAARWLVWVCTIIALQLSAESTRSASRRWFLDWSNNRVRYVAFDSPSHHDTNRCSGPRVLSTHSKKPGGSIVSEPHESHARLLWYVIPIH